MIIDEKPITRSRRLRHLLIGVLVVVGALVATQQWLLGLVRVPSVQMEPTVNAGDRLLVDKALFGVLGVERGDIVLVGSSSQGRFLRVVGLRGDQISCREGRVERNASAIDEPYLSAGTVTDCAAVTVPTGSAYLLGDNRDAAKDSRLEGPYSLDDVHGRMVTRLWSDDPRPDR